MGNVVGGNVPPEVVHRNERLACSGSQPLGKAHPHQQRTDEPRSGGDRHCIDLGQREPGLGQRGLHDAADVFGVAAGGDLRTPPYFLGSSIWVFTTDESTVRPFSTTAAAVSSQEDSMAKIFKQFHLFHRERSRLVIRMASSVGWR